MSFSIPIWLVICWGCMCVSHTVRHHCMIDSATVCFHLSHWHFFCLITRSKTKPGWTLPLPMIEQCVIKYNIYSQILNIYYLKYTAWSKLILSLYKFKIPTAKPQLNHKSKSNHFTFSGCQSEKFFQRLILSLLSDSPDLSHLAVVEHH